MAEVLIYNRNNWMDLPDKLEPSLSGYEATRNRILNNSDLSIEHKTKALYLCDLKYTSRYQRGDIIEIRPDGFWTDGKRKGFGAPKFALIIVPSISFEIAQKYMTEYSDGDIPIKRRRYQVNMSQLQFDENYKLTINNISQAKIIDKSK